MGNAVAQQPANFIGSLKHGNRMAGLVELIGGRQTRRPGADYGCFFPVRLEGMRVGTKPFSKAYSMIVFSIYSIATGGLLMPNTQEVSQGAGQMRPVNSGKLLVEERMW